jgi:hypothetical protein
MKLDGPQQITIVVPAIVCDACVNTIKSILFNNEFVLDDNPRNIVGYTETKKITVALKQGVEVDTLLQTIKDAGYDDPVPFILESESKKRKNVSHYISATDADVDFNPESFVPQTGDPIVHQLRITTAKTKACLYGIQEKLGGTLNLNSELNEEGVVTVVTDPSVTDQQLQDAIYSLTGHSAEPVSSGKRFRPEKQ